MYYIFRETICKNWFEVFIILITLIFILLPELDIPFTDFNFSNLIIPILPTIYFFLNKKTFLEKIKIFKEEIAFAIIFFIYLILLGLLISPYPKTSLFYTVKLLEFLPVFILSLLLFEHKESFYLLILLISILLGIINIILFFFPTLYQTIFHERLFTYPRMQSLIGHPNPYGFAILIFILISFILFENKLISLAVFLLSYIFNSFNLFLTGSKNNFFVFLALSIFIIYKLFKNDKKVIGITLLIYLIFLSLLFYICWIKAYYNLWLKIINVSSRPSFLQNEEKIINRIKELTYYQITTFNFRKELYKRAIETVKNYPLGLGPYVFQAEILKRDKFIVEKFGEKRVKSSHAHNIILQMWLDFGIFNFLFIFGLIYLTLNLKSYLKLYWLMILLANIVDYFLTNIFILYLTIIILGFSLSELKYEKNIN
jgi:hypothetical protein